MKQLTTHKNLHALLAKQKEKNSFEEISTNFIEAWSHFVILPNLETKSFPLATRDLFTWLSADQGCIRVETLMQSGCPSQIVAEDLVSMMGDSSTTYTEFAKMMATLCTTELNIFFQHFYYEKVNTFYEQDVESKTRSVNAESLHTSNTCQKKKRKYRLPSLKYVRKYTCIFRRQKWY